MEDFYENYQNLVQEVKEKSAYVKNQPKDKTLMSTVEMGEMLGLKKTARCWLVKKRLFESKVILGKTWIMIDSFEEWYANQSKYKKVNGEEPGKKLKEWSYSIHDLEKLLGIEASSVYDLLLKKNIETVTVDNYKRVPKKAFYKWYDSQTHYRTKADRLKDQEVEEATITMPEMARLLGVKRNLVYSIIKSQKYKHFFETFDVGDKKRITKKSFYSFLQGQDKYSLDPINDYPEIAEEQNIAIANYRRKILSNYPTKKGVGNQTYLTRNEAAILAKVSPSTISGWCDKNCFTAMHVGSFVRISRMEFENYLVKRKEMEEKDGINQGKKR